MKRNDEAVTDTGIKVRILKVVHGGDAAIVEMLEAADGTDLSGATRITAVDKLTPYKPNISKAMKDAGLKADEVAILKQDFTEPQDVVKEPFEPEGVGPDFGMVVIDESAEDDPQEDTPTDKAPPAEEPAPKAAPAPEDGE